MKTAKKIWNVVSTVLVSLVVLCALFLMGSRLMGYQVFTVISGSMEPELSIGDLLYVKPVEPSSIQVGDDVTFVLNEDLVVATHRVLKNDPQEKYIYTKGLANDIEDAPVHYNNVLGVVEFSIPMLGYVSDFIQNPPGMYITIAVGAVLIILVFLPDFLPKKKEQTEAEEAPAEDGADPAEENARLKKELEELKSQLQENTEAQ